MDDRAIGHGTELLFGEECHAGYERAENQDRVVHGQTPFGRLFAISDGVGGNQDGALAAATVTAELLQSLQQQQTGGSAKQALVAAIERANRRVYDDAAPPNSDGPAQRRMSATLVAALIDTTRDCPVAIIANVGDSRAYLLREGLLSRISTDHTAVQGMIAAGVLTPEQAERHPQSSVLTRSMGQGPQIKSSTERVLLMPGDELLLCSDGLHGYVPESAILTEMMRPGASSQAKASALLYLALGAGGHDNISVQVVAPGISSGRGGSPAVQCQSSKHEAVAEEAQPALHVPVLPAAQTAPASGGSASRYVLFAAVAIALLIGLMLGVYVCWQSRPVHPSQQAETLRSERRCKIFILYQSNNFALKQHRGTDGGALGCAV